MTNYAKRCPECGAMGGSHRANCPEDPGPSDEPRECFNCGAEGVEDDEVCPACGEDPEYPEYPEERDEDTGPHDTIEERDHDRN